MHASWRRAPSVPLLFLGLCVNHVVSMVLESAPPGVASQAGRSLAVSPSTWARAEDANWRLVLAKERNPKTAREEARWRPDADSVEATCRHFNVSITPDPGLGIELGELGFASAADNTVNPLVIVEGLVDGGAAARHAEDVDGNGACVVPGDTLIAVHCESAGLSLSVEAASYDFTVDAIGAAIGTLGPGESLTLTLGRIVRRGRALVTAVRPDGEEERFVCYEGENLRMGLLRRGLKTNDMETQRYDGKPHVPTHASTA